MLNRFALNNFLVLLRSVKIIYKEYQRQKDHLLSCFSTLFDVEEFKIQEDFLQISELVYTKSSFMNRSRPLNSTNRSLPDTYLFDFLPEDLAVRYQTFFTEYRGSPALLSEKISVSGESVLLIYLWLKYYEEVSNFPVKKDLWILGASYNYSLSIKAKDDVKYGEHSFYEQSLKTGKICKPGMFFFPK